MGERAFVVKEHLPRRTMIMFRSFTSPKGTHSTGTKRERNIEGHKEERDTEGGGGRLCCLLLAFVPCCACGRALR